MTDDQRYDYADTINSLCNGELLWREDGIDWHLFFLFAHATVEQRVPGIVKAIGGEE